MAAAENITDLRSVDPIVSSKGVFPEIAGLTDADPRVNVINTLKKLANDFDDEAEAQKTSTNTSDDCNIFLLLSKVFCKSMDTGSYDELTQTMVVKTNQNILAEQQKAYAKLADQSTNQAASTAGQCWTFWGILAAVVVVVACVGLTIATAGAAAPGTFTAAASAVTAETAATATAAVGAAGGTIATAGIGAGLSTLMSAGWTAIGAGGIAQGLIYGAIAGGAGMYFIPKAFGGDDFVPHGEKPDQNKIEQLQNETQEVGAITSRVNNSIQLGSQRISNTSEFCTQMANYIRNAIQDYGQTCRIQIRG